MRIFLTVFRWAKATEIWVTAKKLPSSRNFEVEEKRYCNYREMAKEPLLEGNKEIGTDSNFVNVH